jgi:hypothetical protein
MWDPIHPQGTLTSHCHAPGYTKWMQFQVQFNMWYRVTKLRGSFKTGIA